MTQQEFDNLQVGDEVELLDLQLQRTGKLYRVARHTKTVVLEGESSLKRISNPIRLAFPETKIDKTK